VSIDNNTTNTNSNVDNKVKSRKNKAPPSSSKKGIKSIKTRKKPKEIKQTTTKETSSAKTSDTAATTFLDQILPIKHPLPSEQPQQKKKRSFSAIVKKHKHKSLFKNYLSDIVQTVVKNELLKRLNKYSK